MKLLRRLPPLVLLLLMLGLACGPLPGSSPAFWEMSTYKDFLAGRFRGVSLSRDGRLGAAPRLDTVFSTGQPVVWSAARAPDGGIWLGTGHGGRLYRVDASGRGELVFTAPEPEIFAVAAAPNGRVYAATSPNGKVYAVENGKVSEYFAPGAPLILSLAVAADGSLFAGTGGEGKIYRVRPGAPSPPGPAATTPAPAAPARGELWYDTGQPHVTSLAIDSRQRLLAGTGPNGILYRVEAQGKAFVLYDAGLPEIRSLRAMPDGSVYAAALGGSLARQAPAASSPGASGQAPPLTAPSISITVTDALAQQPPEIRPRPTQPDIAAAPPTPAAPAPLVAEVAGVEKAALYRIAPDHTVETLWTSQDENLYDFAPVGTSLYLSTDDQGRVYELTPGRKLKLVVETRESEALRLLEAGPSLYVATAHLGSLYRLGQSPAAGGEFESPVHDAAHVARWGKLIWRAAACAGCALVLRTRSGNSVRPDATWSEWSGPAGDPDGSPIASPNARYIQWKAEFTGNASLDYARVSYLPQNNPPAVRSLTVSAQPAAAKPAAQGAPAAYTLTVTDTGDTGASSLTGTPTQPVNRAAPEQLQIAWTVEDPDGDRLLYSLYFRAEEQQDWKLLKANLTDASHLLDAEALADGRYFFRVVASDRPSNAPPADREDDLASAPVLIDRTPPAVTIGATQVDAADTASPVTRCEYAIDAGPWTLLAPSDGVADSRRESFTPPALTGTGERLLAIRCYDSANNAGVARRILR